MIEKKEREVTLKQKKKKREREATLKQTLLSGGLGHTVFRIALISGCLMARAAPVKSRDSFRTI